MVPNDIKMITWGIYVNNIKIDDFEAISEAT